MADGNDFYRWVKIKNGIASVAIVGLDVIPNSTGENKIIEGYSGKGFSSQGYIEEVPENGYNAWKLAARRGLEYGFSLVDTCWTVHVHKIQGRIYTDTTATIAGYTVLRAFLNKIDFQLDSKQVDVLENFVLSSWVTPFRELIPDFFNLTFTEYSE